MGEVGQSWEYGGLFYVSTASAELAHLLVPSNGSPWGAIDSLTSLVDRQSSLFTTPDAEES